MWPPVYRSPARALYRYFISIDLMDSKYWTTRLATDENRFPLIEKRTEVMHAGQQSWLRLEATESQALLVQQRLSDLGKTVDYQEEQRGPALFIYLRFQPEEEKAVRQVLADIGLLAADQDEALSA
jgi:hypothetical protein